MSPEYSIDNEATQSAAENRSMELREQELKQNFDRLKIEIPESVTLVAVSKTFPFSDIELVLKLGHKEFGENKVQELEKKAKYAFDNSLPIHWHFIGKLQSNKVKKLLSIPNLKSIHSVDSLKLARELVKNEGLLSAPIDVFIQVNTSFEKEKSGLLEAKEVKEVLEVLSCSSKLKPVGLMTIGPIRTEDFESDAQKSFDKLKELRDSISTGLKLSMGMSSDYRLAVAAGSNYLRIGSILFGKRSSSV